MSTMSTMSTSPPLELDTPAQAAPGTAVAMTIPDPVASPITISGDTTAPISLPEATAAPVAPAAQKGKRASPVREILREIDIEGQVYRVPLDITPEAFHLVRNMVLKSAKAVAFGGGKASPYDLVLAYGRPVVPLRTPTARPQGSSSTHVTDI